MSDTFVLTDAHLKLLEAMSWRWNDTLGIGAPEVDAKRPFGFSYGYEQDIAEIIGMAPDGEADGEPALTEEQEDEARRIYSETLTALEVMLSARSCRPGRYFRDDLAMSGGRWRFLGAVRGRSA